MKGYNLPRFYVAASSRAKTTGQQQHQRFLCVPLAHSPFCSAHPHHRNPSSMLYDDATIKRVLRAARTRQGWRSVAANNDVNRRTAYRWIAAAQESEDWVASPRKPRGGRRNANITDAHVGMEVEGRLSVPHSYDFLAFELFVKSCIIHIKACEPSRFSSITSLASVLKSIVRSAGTIELRLRDSD
ncbi:unnamed protein product [Phytophthora fragariaefolia]|uniref:Unnamed protein product n=1 Tax=Phytophthora fragariaefolia TaxID=1490495 RepID=A0A9W6YJG1_9STRA|nr:unnamed protein product [Phytophthora fragariaefolia]